MARDRALWVCTDPLQDDMGGPMSIGFRHHAWWLLLLALMSAGCSRTRYRTRADGETYGILREKTDGRIWNLPSTYQVEPDPRARFFNPTSLDDPELPVPGPRLYGYELPELPPRDVNRLYRSVEPEAVPAPSDSSEVPDYGPIRPVAYLQPDPSGPTVVPEPMANEGDGTQPIGHRQLAAIRREVWNSLPRSCLIRMLEFESIRAEYKRSFESQPDPRMRDPSQRLTLEDIVDLAVINSHSYQSQKEALYSVALRLTLDRYDYSLKFSNFGNGTDVNYSHSRNAGITSNNLGIPTRINGEKVLATGGNLLARFANDVVLTFNGPSGFAADVGSDMFLNLSQSVFQRDIVFERLTQSERNVIYAARDFARFRKTMFSDLASQYYALILNYRDIEIDAQNYFSNLRAFNEANAEFRVGRRSRTQVDQIEQDVLSSRSSLISRCTGLERSFDNIKLLIGLPTETPINLDLGELEQLTLRDEVTVTFELVLRSRANLKRERISQNPDRILLLNYSLDLTQKLLAFAQLSQKLQSPPVNVNQLREIQATLLVQESDIIVESNRTVLNQEQAKVPPVPPLRIFQRSEDLINTILTRIKRELELARLLGAAPQVLASLERDRQALVDRHARMILALDTAIENQNIEEIPKLVIGAIQLLAECDRLAPQAARLAGRENLNIQQERIDSLQRADHLLKSSELSGASYGLTPLEVEMDSAMLTALIQRFDLMNEYGRLADTWRQIKLAGDDLKTVLNLNASQLIRTRSDVNRVFDFTFDESETRLALSVDTPLNRKAQRNAFRTSLINYQAALRNVIALQDQVKLSIRNDLRSLQLDREQYGIAVASAALAYERVVSTQLQMDLNIADISARDFLEAQEAYTRSLRAVAGQHIGYILDRIQLFMDMETLQVDEAGFWPELYDESYQPDPQLARPPSAGPVYGTLPPGLRQSCKIRRMLHIPEAPPEIHQPNQMQQPEQVQPAADIPNNEQPVGPLPPPVP